MDKEFTRRTGDCRIKLAPDMMDRLERMARSYGMPPATLAAFALAEWVNQKENSVSMSRMAVMDIGRKIGGVVEAQLKEMADSPEFEEHTLRTASAFSQPHLALDNGESGDSK